MGMREVSYASAARSNSAKRLLYLLLALHLQEVLPFATFTVVCGVLLQVLQLGGS